MGLFYQNGVLHFGEEHRVDLTNLAKKTDRPFYVYDLEGIRLRVRALKNAYPGINIHYAMKANGATPILKLFLEEGTGIDVVSAGEVKIALDHGFPPEKIIFSGVGKTVKEVEFAVDQKIRQINVESPQELERIIEIAKQKKAKPNVAFRMNPDVDAQTHPYITTGFRENKFGMGEYFLNQLIDLLKNAREHVNLCGVTLHIGSQLLNLAPIEDAIKKTMPIYQRLKSEGFAMRTFDVGGGIGIQYKEPHSYPAHDLKQIAEYGALLKRAFGPDFSDTVLCEPGRILVGSCGVLVGEVQYLKETPFRNFIILNTGMHHLMRPALYQAFHRIMPLKEAGTAKTKSYDVVGPICESSDVLGKDRDLSDVQRGDFLAIADAGAYGYTMASHYNEHSFPAQYYWDHGKISES